MSAGKTVVAVVAVLLLGAGLLVVREVTISEDVPVRPDSRMVVMFTVAHRFQAAHTDARVAESLFGACRLEANIDTDVVAFEQRDADRFRVVLEPALNETDRLQLRGCLEDTKLAHVLGDVLRMSRIDSVEEVPRGPNQATDTSAVSG